MAHLTARQDPIGLRGHHWICLRFFAGEGYSAGFVANLATVMDRLLQEDAVVVEGPDSVCAACVHLVDGRCENAEAGEEEVRRIDRLAMDLLDLRPDERQMLWSQPPDFEGVLRMWRTQACPGCVWERLCVEKMGPTASSVSP